MLCTKYSITTDHVCKIMDITLLVTLLVCGTGTWILMILLLIRSETTQNKVLYYAGSFFLRMAALFREKTIFTIDYGGGFNLHFECSQEELRQLLPRHLEPIPMKVVHEQRSDRHHDTTATTTTATETTIKENPDANYLVTVYSANTHLSGTPSNDDTHINRADVFTYVIDQDGKLGLYFVSALIQYPSGGKQQQQQSQDTTTSTTTKFILQNIMHFFGMDPTTYTMGYPHHELEFMDITDNSFWLKHKRTTIQIQQFQTEENSCILSRQNQFDLQFIKANSQIYRGEHGAKNVNYFNQDFINASVTCWDPTKAIVEHPEDIHPLCRKLVAIESYRGSSGNRNIGKNSSDRHSNDTATDTSTPIRWYFENN